ncbi:MAG: hypothetical protein R3270_09565 [Gammaproteobacteria bacterium]|nr:hypothetical protein [Gammaproteobacteria bacterium]
MKNMTALIFLLAGLFLAGMAMAGLYNSTLGTRHILLVTGLAAGFLLLGMGIGRLLPRK